MCPICKIEIIHTNKNNGKRFEGKPCKKCSPTVEKNKSKNYKNVCVSCGIIELTKYKQRVKFEWMCEKCRYKVTKSCVICGNVFSSRKYDIGKTCSDKCKFIMIAQNMGGPDTINISQIGEYKINRRVGGGKNQAKESNGMWGKKHSEETKTKIRIKRTSRFNTTGISPRINPIACKVIDEYGKQMGYEFQHGMNGGEYYIEELGYYVDGYDSINNVVVEYDELYHQQPKQKELDSIRQQQIIEKLNCKFVRLVEQKDGSILYNILNS